MQNILVIESSSSYLQMIDLSLKQAGLNIEIARTDSEALVVAKQQKFDVVLCDLDKIGTEPIQLIKQFCILAKDNDSSFIVIANSKLQNKKQEAMAAGAAQWISKPFDPDELLNQVLAVMH